MSRILVTGSSEGLGRAAAEALLAGGHDVVVHARTDARLAVLAPLLDRGALAVVGDLAALDQVQDVAAQANALGVFDAVIHNAGVLDGGALLPVNVVAPYVLTAQMARPRRLIYLSSGMHRGGSPSLAGVDWSGARRSHSYSDSKLFLTTLAAAVAQSWPEVSVHAVDPGWVPTRMGGPSANDDLAMGHQTQAWLAAEEQQPGFRYWFHRDVQQPHPAVHDGLFQAELMRSLADFTGHVLAGAA